MRPFFSILIPVYNKAGQMEDCIRSLKSQSFTDFETIFVNDGSTDRSAEELDRYCSEDSRFRTLTHEKNSSVMTARYTGMQAACGKYILFLDSDDTYSPDTCEKIHDLLEKDPVDIVRFDIIEEPEMKLRTAESFPEGVLDAFMHGKISPTVWKNCYSYAVIKRAVERIEPFYSNMAEDLFISAVLYHCADSFAVINDTLYHYQTGSGMSTTRKVTPEKIKRDMASLCLTADHFYAYTDSYCPEYREQAEFLMKRAMRYVFINSVWEDDDLVNVLECVYAIRGERTQWLYEEACREAIPAVIRKKYKLSDSRMELAGIKFDRFTWFD